MMGFLIVRTHQEKCSCDLTKQAKVESKAQKVYAAKSCTVQNLSYVKV